MTPLADLLVCPRCRRPGVLTPEAYHCATEGCVGELPKTAAGAPIMLDPQGSVFFDAATRPGPRSGSAARRALRRAAAWMPRVDHALGAPARLRRFLALVRATNSPVPARAGVARRRVLAIGAASGNAGLAAFEHAEDIWLIRGDVGPTPGLDLLLDAHQLPFATGALDAVILQWVLEHTFDPARVVAEVHRVLAPGGLVFCEVPFMQQVHLGALDFVRFTHLGHRRLFREFAEVASGCAQGPATALGWSWRYFLQSFSPSRSWQRLARLLAGVSGFWLKYLDLVLARRPGAYDAGGGYYFIGRRAETPLTDTELLAGYRGAIWT